MAIAKIAYSQLHENSIQYLSRVMDKPVDLETFQHMSVWADRVAYTPGYNWSKRLHYTHEAKSLGSFTLQQDPQCLLSSISYFTRILLDDESVMIDPFPPLRQSDALQFLIHFVGDLHAPFHIGDKEDLNGLLIKVYDPVSCLLKHKIPKTPRLSLHAVWDTHIISIAESKERKTLDQIVEEYIKSIEHRNTRTLRGRAISLSDSDALSEITLRTARRCHKITQDVGLKDETGKRIVSGDFLRMEYFDIACPAAMEQIKIAGVNLATLINRIADAAADHTLPPELEI